MLETGYIPCLDDDSNFENKIVNGAWWEDRKWERMVVKKDEETGIELQTDLGPDLPGKSFNGKRWVDFELKGKLRDLALLKMVQEGQDDREAWLEKSSSFESLKGLSDL